MNVNLEGMTPDQVANLAALAKGLGDNPETRGDFLKLVKRAKPDLPIPEVDLPGQMHAVLAPLQEKIERLEREKLESDSRQNILNLRADVVKQGLAKDTDIPEIERLMLEQGITNHATAAKFYAAQQHSATPTPSQYTGGPRTLPRFDPKALGVSTPKQAARQLAINVLDDIRAGRIVAGT